jgi:putative GTP pyrophosphokinase
MNKDVAIENAIEAYESQKHVFERFMKGIIDFLELEPELNSYENPIIHTIKSRLKDVEHLRDKISRKWDDNSPITQDNIFERVNDLSGVRILHLYQDQFPKIHEFIMKRISDGDWYLTESPIAYSWDPEAKDFFESLDLNVKIKESYYTSIHYVVKPKPETSICCEIQVRTLFEEVWGEIDHIVNYPHPTQSLACREQLRVLSKLVSTGTRLADSIFRTQEWHTQELNPRKASPSLN